MIANQGVLNMPSNSEKKPRVLAADVRRREMSLKELQAQAEQLRAFVAEFEGLLAVMKSRNYKSVNIDGVKKPGVAFDALRGWLANVDTAINRKRLGL